MADAQVEAMINALISSVSENSIRNFIRQQNRSFIELHEDLTELLSENSTFCQLTKLGEIEYADTNKLMVFSCLYDGELSARSARKMQFEIAKKALKEDFKDGAVFVFYDAAGRFRFSFIRRNYGDKDQKYSNWKRFTYFVEPDAQTNRTFIERVGGCKFDSLDGIQLAFSVEPLSKEFFNGYKAQYEKFCNYMQTDAQIQYDFREFLADGTNKAVRDYVKKMLGRIVFLHFIQKKGWMGIASDSTLWVGGDPNFIENLFISSNESQQDNFLDEVLEPMFFHSLNKPRPNDWYDTKTGLGMVKIPYLNGGLFEPDKLDDPDSKFPASYFKELFTFFNRYNFTIDENDPNDAEVGVDPEMLGHIFENLLEDNKDKGAFYTPKEIVHYMCQESLTEYLCTALHIENPEERQLIEQLVKYHEVSEKLHNRLNDIKQALDKVKICDPAIGSGAFPMGLLQEIFAIKQAVWFYENNDLDRFPASEIKQQIIQNSIYGVDIEKGAVDIARLRFWLSLVVDETTPQPLPNLDYKIMQGNSLIESFEGHDLSKIIKTNPTNKLNKNLLGEIVNPQLTLVFDSEQTELNLNMLLKDYFKTTTTEDKLAKKIQIEEQVKEHIKNCAGHTPDIIERVNAIDFNNKSFFLWHLYFADVFENGGFDIVIGNPPYVGERKNKSLFIPVQKSPTKKYYLGRIDYFYFFFHISIDLLRLKGVCSFITTNYFPTALGARKLRADLKERTSILGIINFNEAKVFDSAAGQHNMITFFSKGKFNVSTKIVYIDKKGLLLPDEISKVLNCIDKNTTTIKINGTDLWDGKENYIRFNGVNKISSPINRILDKIITQSTDLLGNICSPLIGLESSLDNVFVLSWNDIVKITNNKRNELCLIKPFFKNSDVKKYYVDQITDKYILYLHEEIKNIKQYEGIWNYLLNNSTAIKSRKGANLRGAFKRGNWWVLNTPRLDMNFNDEKIVTPYRTKSLKFALSTDEWHASRDVYYIVKKKENVSLKYILSILNSKLYYSWFYHRGKRKGDTLEIYAKPLKEVPIKEICFLKQNIFIDLINKILVVKKENQQSDTTHLERQIDELVFKLYGLTYEEVLVVDKNFWLSVEEYEKVVVE